MSLLIHTIISQGVKDSCNSVIRDFGEIENFLNNPNQAFTFAEKTNQYFLLNLQKNLEKYKPTYSIKKFDGSLIPKQDESNYFYLSGILGLTNFSRGSPNFACSAYLERDSQVFASVIYNPITYEMFYAEKGQGAFYNKRKLRYRSSEKIEAPLTIATDKIAVKNLDFDSYQFICISNCKALELCYLSANKIDDCIFKEKTPYHLLAPALLIAQEAGIVFDIVLDDKKNIISLKKTN
ncbi:putative SuhB-like inositol monophosphatase [Candidatus Hepatincolaceae symbiont of Richtersius coronifer]